jgi:large subunit ribosomal protein L30
MTAVKKKKAVIRVQQIKSGIGYNRRQREVLKGMGIRRMHQIVELPDNDASWGMIRKVPHLVRVLEAESGDAAEGRK